MLERWAELTTSKAEVAEHCAHLASVGPGCVYVCLSGGRKRNRARRRQGWGARGQKRGRGLGVKEV